MSYEDNDTYTGSDVLDVAAEQASTAIEITIDHSPLNSEQARQLTNTIRDASEVLWVLIARAHAGKAWQALGYETWERYVRSEFDMSRSRSYQLLDQARVIAAIESAVPAGTEIHLSEAAARDLKSVIEEAIPEIRERTEGLEPEEAKAVVEEYIEEVRKSATSNDVSPETTATPVNFDPNYVEDLDGVFDDEDFTDTPTMGGAPSKPTVSLAYDPVVLPQAPAADKPAEVDAVDVTRIRRNVNAAHDLYSSLSALAGLPDDLDEVVAIIPIERHQMIQANLEAARANLDRFAALWDDRDDEQ